MSDYCLQRWQLDDSSSWLFSLFTNLFLKISDKNVKSNSFWSHSLLRLFLKTENHCEIYISDYYKNACCKVAALALKAGWAGWLQAAVLLAAMLAWLRRAGWLGSQRGRGAGQGPAGQQGKEAQEGQRWQRIQSLKGNRAAGQGNRAAGQNRAGEQGRAPPAPAGQQVRAAQCHPAAGEIHSEIICREVAKKCKRDRSKHLNTTSVTSPIQNRF